MKFSPEVVAAFVVLLGSADAYYTNFPTADHTHTETEHLHQAEHVHQADHLHQADHVHQTEHFQQYHPSIEQQQHAIARRHAEAMKADILSQMKTPKNQKYMSMIIARREAEAEAKKVVSGSGSGVKKPKGKGAEPSLFNGGNIESGLKMPKGKDAMYLNIARRDAEARIPGDGVESGLAPPKGKNARFMKIGRRDAEARMPGGGVESGLAPPKGKNARFMKIGRRDAEAEAKNIHIPGHPKLTQRDIDELDYYSILARDIESEWVSLDAILQIREAREKAYGKPRIGILAKQSQRRDLMPSDEFDDGFERREFWEDE